MAAEMDHPLLFKLLLIGDSGVGKSSMLLRYADDAFKEDLGFTLGVDFKVCTRTIEGRTVKMTMWDTAGQERFRTISSSYYRGSHGVIIAYDVADRASFEHARGWAQEIEKYASEGVARLLVGNKCDLAAERAVDPDEGRELAEDLGARFMETSAKNSHNIWHAFDSLAREVLVREAEAAGAAPWAARAVPVKLGKGRKTAAGKLARCCG